MAGAALGALGGAAVSVAIITAEGHAGRYLYDVDDLGWRIAPIPAGVIGGAVLGYRDADRLRSAALGGLIGAGAGGLAGAVVGAAAWGTPEAAWSGWILGGATGILVGSLVGALEHRTEADPGPQLTIAWTLRR